MKNATWIPLLAAAMIMACFGEQAQAGYLGAGRYKCCPTEACTSCGDYCAAKECSSTCYKTVVETVWEKQNYTCQKTGYDTVCEKVPVQYTKHGYKTCYRDECYTVCKRSD